MHVYACVGVEQRSLSIDDEGRCRRRLSSRPTLPPLRLGSITRPHRGVKFGNFDLRLRLSSCFAERERSVGMRACVGAGDVHGVAGEEVGVVVLGGGGGGGSSRR